MAKRNKAMTTENKKQKHQSRGRKLKRKRERECSEAKTLVNVFAQTDENGFLQSTPQERKKDSIGLENIQISTPLHDHLVLDTLKERIEFFNADKGYGFIKDLASIDKYFFHISEAPSNIAERDMVTYEIERGAKGMTDVRL